MKILVVIPHYFGPAHPENNLPAIGSYLEPLGRIAAVNEMIVALHAQFGPNRHTLEGTAIPADREAEERRVDIVVVTMREHNLLAELGLATGAFAVEYVDGKAPWIAFHAHRLLRDRLDSAYDFYCYMEDDLVIRDPAFFDKLTWFQRTFGPKTLLAPVRYEMSSTGTPAKVIADPVLPVSMAAPFRRPDQREEIEGLWNGRSQMFRLAGNPHAGSFFLTREQMAYWVRQPTFDDGDASWAGPLESAGTLSVGKVFDIYKPTRPDPFFLDILHCGTRYASQWAPPGRRYGEPPLLAIAQNALRAAIARGEGGREIDESFSALIGRWLAQGTAVELRADVDRLGQALQGREAQIESLDKELRERKAQIESLDNELRERQARIESLDSGLRERQAEIESLGNELRERQERIGHLEQAVDRQQRDIEQVQADVARYRAEMDSLQDHLAAAGEDAKHRQEQIEDQQRAIASVIAERDSIAAALAAETATLNLRSHSLRWLLGALRAEIKRRWTGAHRRAPDAPP